MWNEVTFAEERIASRTKAEAVVMQGAILSVLDKAGSAHFKELLEKLDGK